MNYRHGFHAGNFADVVKHAVLTRVLVYLQQKPAAVHVIDTHAGPGLYDLTGEAATRTGEWRGGIGRLTGARLSPPARDLLSPWLDVVAAVNTEAGVTGEDTRCYPGSPVLIQRLLRRGDRLSACELHPDDAEALKAALAGDRQTRVYDLDGWLALKSFLPPKERRGLILVDPPFERTGEFDRLVLGLTEAVRRFSTGTYLMWHPIKVERDVHRFHAALVATGLRRIMAITHGIGAVHADGPLTAAGLVVVNPPFRLVDELRVILPELTRLMQKDAGAWWQVTELAGE